MKKLKPLLLGLALGTLGACVGFWGARHGLKLSATSHWSKGQVLGLLALLPVAWLVAVGLHELGHALAGRLQGFRLHWLTVGPLMWRRQPSGRLRFEWNLNLNMAGGLVLSVPPDDVRLRERFRVFTLGGPLGSLFWAALALGVFTWLPVSSQSTLPAVAVALSGAISLLLFVFTMLPFQAGGLASDGMRLLNLSRPGTKQELEVAMLTATIRSMAGVRPRELSRPALEAADALRVEHPYKAYVAYYLYQYHLDAGDPAAAGLYLARYRAHLDQQPVALQASGWLEAAFFSAAYEHDAQAARTYQSRAVVNAHTPTEQPFRVEAALARLEGNVEQARTQAEAALRELPRTLSQGSARLYEDWLRETLRWAEQAADGKG
ncbi:M50 family metallopeptidase [Hymenobacter lutimineralis]|uniref:M50 family metallopeptidase n=1 Tax=Hymenobacter lutimineralis TaxID=2606448 RepID=A0A5D6UYN4_9BACT|nr:M50 family metallopeptidase [Hymenobacter lutimineralis]TYZ08125.1 M50 family metallopeptidase [Hymenobacter lutimineralis]